MDVHRCRFVDFPPSAINALAFSSTSNPSAPEDQSRLAVGRANGDIEIWNPLDGIWLHESTFYGGKDRSIEDLAWVQDPDEEDDQGHHTPGKLRLFSIGCSSTVTEWDWSTGLPIRNSSGSHSDVWCIAAQPEYKRPESQRKSENQEGSGTHRKIAIGCNDGSVALLSTQDNNLTFDRFVVRTSEKKARALCMTWRSRNVLAVGFADSTIRVYGTGSNRKDPLIRTITLGGGPRGGRKEKLIWALSCLPDGTLVSGDSTGEVCWWDREHYGQLQKIQAHDADVLCLASSSDGKTIFSGGIDRRTVIFTINNNASSAHHRWTKSSHTRQHMQDVKTMARFESGKMSVVASGGPDAQLIITPMQQQREEYHRRLPFLPQVPPVAGAQRLLVSWWSQYVTIWKVPKKTPIHQEGTHTNFEVVARMCLKGDENISTACLSEDGKLLAVATMAETRLFNLRRKNKDQGDAMRISKVTLPPRCSQSGSRVLKFSPDGHWIVQVNESNQVFVYRVRSDPGTGDLSVSDQRIRLKRLDQAKGHDLSNGYQRRIACAAFASDSSIVATADLAGFVDVWHFSDSRVKASSHASDTSSEDDSDGSSVDANANSLPTNADQRYRWQHTPSRDSLPRLSSAPLTISFCPAMKVKSLIRTQLTNGNGVTSDPSRHSANQDNLIVVTATHELLEYSALCGRLTAWSRRNPFSSLPASFRMQRERTMGCFWDCGPEGVGHRKRLWLYASTWLCMIDMNRDMPLPQAGKSAAHEGALMAPLNAKSRKRKQETLAQEQLRSKRRTAGAGSKKKPLEREDTHQRLGNNDYGLIASHTSQPLNGHNRKSSKDADSSEEDMDSANMTLMKLRRQSHERASDSGSDSDKDGEMSIDDTAPLVNGHKQRRSHEESTAGIENIMNDSERPPFYLTSKYRPILGIVPLWYEEANEEEFLVNGDVEATGRDRVLEVALIERPEHDLGMSTKAERRR